MDTDHGSAGAHLSPTGSLPPPPSNGGAPPAEIDLTEHSAGPDAGDTDRLLANVVRASVNPYAVLDADGRVMFVSQPIVDIIGVPAEACVGQHVLEFISPAHHLMVATAIAEFVNPERDDDGWTGPPISVDLVHADGHLVPCRVLGVGSGTVGFHGVVVRIRQTVATQKLDAAIAGMITSRDLSEVLSLLLDVLIDQVPSTSAAVGLDWDGRTFATTVATDTAPWIDQPVPDGADEDLSAGLPWARALATRAPASVDVDDLPAEVAAAAAAGLGTCWAFPIGGRDHALIVWRPTSGPPTQHLREAIERIVQMIQLALTSHHARRNLEREARTDPLTGLANRLALFDRIEEIGEEPERAGVGILYCDLDDFKPINDRFGHGTGDRVLTIAAHRIASQVRTGDLVARLGGDEFAILCVGADAARLAGLARRLLRSFDEPIVIDGQSVHVGLSVGSSLLDEAHTGSPTDILHEADHALLAAKAGGKGTWRAAR